MIVTAELKDRILNDFLNVGNSLELNYYTECQEYGVDADTFKSIMNYFADEKLIKVQASFMQGMLFSLTIHAHDLYNRGGFYAQEELLKANINKLGLELESLTKELTPNQLDRVNKISTIANAITSALTFFK